jgi:hypothetical protein
VGTLPVKGFEVPGAEFDVDVEVDEDVEFDDVDEFGEDGAPPCGELLCARAIDAASENIPAANIIRFHIIASRLLYRPDGRRRRRPRNG